jgi:hypothetical protein
VIAHDSVESHYGTGRSVRDLPLQRGTFDRGLDDRERSHPRQMRESDFASARDSTMLSSMEQ